MKAVLMVFKWIFGHKNDQQKANQKNNKLSKNISPIKNETQDIISEEICAAMNNFLENFDLFSGLNHLRLVWLFAGSGKHSVLHFDGQGAIDLLFSYDDLYVTTSPQELKQLSSFEAAISAVENLFTEEINTTPKNYTYRDPADAAYMAARKTLQIALKKYSFRSLFMESIGQEMSEYYYGTINKYWLEEKQKVQNLLESRKKFLKPLLIKAKRDSIDEFGNQSNIALEKLFVDFFEKSFDQQDAENFKLLAISAQFDSAIALPFCYECVENWLSDLVPSEDMPDDGIEFEHWCADQLQKFGWTAQVSKASGDQGADVMAYKDELTVCIQCKRYAKPVGNKAVQEVVAAKIHTGADYGCVIATGGFTKSAVELAKTTSTVLIPAESISDFDDCF